MKDCERPAATILIVWCTTVCKQRHVIAHCAVGVGSLYHVLIHAAVLWFHSHSAVGWQPISYSHSCSCIACYIYDSGLCACARFLLLEGHWFCAYHVSCVVVSTCTFRSEFTMVHSFFLSDSSTFSRRSIHQRLTSLPAASSTVLRRHSSLS